MQRTARRSFGRFSERLPCEARGRCDCFFRWLSISLPGVLPRHVICRHAPGIAPPTWHLSERSAEADVRPCSRLSLWRGAFCLWHKKANPVSAGLASHPRGLLRALRESRLLLRTQRKSI